MRLQLGPRTCLLVPAALALATVFSPDAGGFAPDSDAPVKAKAPASSVAMFGGTVERNLVNLVEKNIPDNWNVEPKKGALKNVKWEVKLGTHSYGGPVVADGRIFVGTNNERPRDPLVKGDKGIMMCFREADGQFLWQLVHDKLGDDDQDFHHEGVASTPCVEGERLYYVSNRCELICADVKGDPTAKGKGKVVWKYDMIEKLGVYPCQLANCSPLIVGENVYAVTGNGVNVSNKELPSPNAPSFVAFNKATGKLAWKSSLPGKKVMRGQWGNPAATTIDGKTQVLFPGGDGVLYGLDAKSGELLWKFDCNPKAATPYRAGGGGERCFFLSAPVVYDKKVYVAVGQEPDAGPGVGHLWCIDPTKKPANKDKDLSPVNDNFDPKAAVNKSSGLVWHYGGPVVPAPKNDEREIVFGRTMGTVAIYDGVVYASELAGYLHAVDAKTGAKLWVHDFQESTWCSPYYVDGKVFVGTDNELYLFKAGRKLAFLRKIAMGGPIKVPPVAANGVLYVNTGTNLYAIAPAK